MLHYLDDLDSKMESMRAHFQREPDSEWTTYNSSLERPLLNSRRFLDKQNSTNGNGATSADAAQEENSSAAAASEEK